MRRAMLFSLFTALMISTTHAQNAQPAQNAAPALPQWDSRAHCERQNRIMATESAMILRNCLDGEERAVNILRRDWDAAPAAARRTCLRQQQTMRSNSYFMLNSCIQMESEATRDIQRR
jgi:hypothetical protein